MSKRERGRQLNRIKETVLAILNIPRIILRAFTAWQQRRPGPTRYIKIPTPEEIEQARVAVSDPNNPASFSSLVEKSIAKKREVEARNAEAERQTRNKDDL